MKVVTSKQREQFIAEMNAKWQRKYQDYQRWLNEDINDQFIEEL